MASFCKNAAEAGFETQAEEALQTITALKVDVMTFKVESAILAGLTLKTLDNQKKIMRRETGYIGKNDVLRAKVLKPVLKAMDDVLKQKFMAAGTWKCCGIASTVAAAELTS